MDTSIHIIYYYILGTKCSSTVVIKYLIVLD